MLQFPLVHLHLSQLLPASGLIVINADVLEGLRCPPIAGAHLMLIATGSLRPDVHLHLSQQLTHLTLGCVEHNVRAALCGF